MDRRFEDTEAEFIRKLDELGLPVILVLTQVPRSRDGHYHPDAVALAEQIAARRLPIVGGRPFLTYAKPDPFTGQRSVRPARNSSMPPFALRRKASTEPSSAAQEIDQARKAAEAQKFIAAAAASQRRGGGRQPRSRSPTRRMLVPIQLGMMARIAQLYKIKFERAALMAIASTTAATQVGPGDLHRSAQDGARAPARWSAGRSGPASRRPSPTPWARPGWPSASGSATRSARSRSATRSTTTQCATRSSRSSEAAQAAAARTAHRPDLVDSALNLPLAPQRICLGARSRPTPISAPAFRSSGRAPARTTGRHPAVPPSALVH